MHSWSMFCTRLHHSRWPYTTLGGPSLFSLQSDRNPVFVLNRGGGPLEVLTQNLLILIVRGLIRSNNCMLMLSYSVSQYESPERDGVKVNIKSRALSKMNIYYKTPRSTFNSNRSCLQIKHAYFNVLSHLAHMIPIKTKLKGNHINHAHYVLSTFINYQPSIHFQDCQWSWLPVWYMNFSWWQ